MFITLWSLEGFRDNSWLLRILLFDLICLLFWNLFNNLNWLLLLTVVVCIHFLIIVVIIVMICIIHRILSNFGILRFLWMTPIVFLRIFRRWISIVLFFYANCFCWFRSTFTIIITMLPGSLLAVIATAVVSCRVTNRWFEFLFTWDILTFRGITLA